MEDYFVIPHIIGPIVRLHPLVVLFAMLSGGAIAGILGILLAVPATATLRIILMYLYGKLTEGPEVPPEEPVAGTGADGEASSVPPALAPPAEEPTDLK